MTESSEKAFQDAKFCSICRKPLDWNEKRNYPVRDHDHTKPKNNYRGAAHRFVTSITLSVLRRFL